MEPILFGSLVLSANRAVPTLDIVNLPHVIGKHVKGRYNGMWSEANSMAPYPIFIPQRYKRLSLSCTNDLAVPQFVDGLSAMDAQHGEARQQYKLGKLLDDVDCDCAATVNIAQGTQSEVEVSGSFYLLSKNVRIYLALVFDTDEQSVQLVWSTLDFKALVQQRRHWRYVFYAMPDVYNMPVFIHTQQLCSRWWKLMRDFDSDPHKLLRAANAIELALFKDPSIKSYNK